MKIFQEFTQLEKGGRDKASHALSEVIGLLGHVRSFHNTKEFKNISGVSTKQTRK